MSSDNVKNVDLKQCIGTIIYALIALCIVFVPITFGEAGLSSAYNALPVIGDGSFGYMQAKALQGFMAVTHMELSSVNFLAYLFAGGTYAYFIIFILDIIFCIVLFITRSEITRLIFKIISIIAGVIMLINGFACILYIVGFAGLFIQAIIPADQIMVALETSGILFIIAMMLFSFFAVKKQIKWFAKLF